MLDRTLTPTSQVFEHPAEEKPNVAGLGASLYTDHLVTVGLAGVLLFVALIGAVAITNPRRPEPAGPDPAQAVASSPRVRIRLFLQLARHERRNPWPQPTYSRWMSCAITCWSGPRCSSLGMLGFLSRRNLIVMFLSAEMMLQGMALSLVGFGRYHGNWTGQVFTIMILTVAACEASIALALIVILYNRRSSLDVTLWQDLREADVPATPRPTSPRKPSRSWGARPRVVSASDPRRHRAGPPRATLDRTAKLSCAANLGQGRDVVSEQPESERRIKQCPMSPGFFVRYAWLIPFFPLLGAVGAVGARRLKIGPLPGRGGDRAGVPRLARGRSFGRTGPEVDGDGLVTASDFHIPIEVRVDGLSTMMLSMVTFVSGLVAIFAAGYMTATRDTPGSSP